MLIYITDNLCESWFLPLGCNVVPSTLDEVDQYFTYDEWDKGSMSITQSFGTVIYIHNKEIIDYLKNRFFEQCISYNTHVLLEKVYDPTFEITSEDKVYFISPETKQVYLITPNQLPY